VAYAVQLTPSIKGFKITHKPYDDSVNGVHDPQKGAQNFADMWATRTSWASWARSTRSRARDHPRRNARASSDQARRTPTSASRRPSRTATRSPRAAADRKGTTFRIAAPDTVQVRQMAASSAVDTRRSRPSLGPWTVFGSRDAEVVVLFLSGRSAAAAGRVESLREDSLVFDGLIMTRLARFATGMVARATFELKRATDAQDVPRCHDAAKFLRALLGIVHAVHRVVVWLVRDLEALCSA